MIRSMTRRSMLVACLALLAAASLGLPASVLRAEDEAPHAWLGVDLGDVDDEARKELKLPDDSGVQIAEVHPDTAAAKAELKAEDIITQVDGKPAPNVEGFVAMIATKKPGDVLELTIVREKKEMKIKVTLGKKPAE